MSVYQWELNEQPVPSEKMRRLAFSVADTFADLATVPVGDRFQGRMIYCLENNRLYEWDAVLAAWGPPPGMIWTASTDTGVTGRPPAKLGAACYRTDKHLTERYNGTQWESEYFYGLTWAVTCTQGGAGVTLTPNMAEATMSAGLVHLDASLVVTAGAGVGAGAVNIGTPAGYSPAGSDRVIGRAWFSDISAGVSPVGDVTLGGGPSIVVNPGFQLAVGDVIRLSVCYRPN